MQHAHKRSQAKEVRVRLHEHPLDLVQLRCGRRALLLRCLDETLGERGKDGELPVCHRLELDLERQGWGCGVDFDVL